MTVLVSQQTQVDGAFTHPLHLFTLKNAHGMQVTLANLGASVRSLLVPGRDGVKDVTLNYEAAENWFNNPYFLGVIVGRCANRIGHGRYEHAGKVFQLPCNDGVNHLHGGADGLAFRFWQGHVTEAGDSASVTFSVHVADGEDGYPGNLTAHVKYTLNQLNELHIEYHAQADQDCPLNLTSHMYFNLAGCGSVLDQRLTLNAAGYLDVDEQLIPTGHVIEVSGGPMDFRQPKTIGSDIGEVPGGYDHFWQSSLTKHARPEMLAALWDEKSGRALTLLSTEPGVQFYSGNFLDGSLAGANGKPLQQYAGLCLEPHIHPDAVNHAHFPTVITPANQPYHQHSIYRFSII